jgi:hypothetical protein
MSWHPSRARSGRVLLRTGVVRALGGRSMLVRLDSGHDRLLPLPDPSSPALVGSTVLVRDDRDWVVAVAPPEPDEAVAVRHADHHAGGGPAGGDVADLDPREVALDLRSSTGARRAGGGARRRGRVVPLRRASR